MVSRTAPVTPITALPDFGTKVVNGALTRVPLSNTAQIAHDAALPPAFDTKVVNGMLTRVPHVDVVAPVLPGPVIKAPVLPGPGTGAPVHNPLPLKPADYSTQTSGVNVNTETQSATDMAGKTINLAGGARDFTNVTGSNFADNIKGGAKSETLNGGAGNDTLSGKAGNDQLLGGAGNDLLNGGTGADKLDGGAGTDTATYIDALSGVNANLQTGVGTAGEAAGDRFTSIENLTGSNFNDVLTGDAGNNVLDGGKGNDVFVGGAGADTIYGGEGIDTVSYAASKAGVRVTLENPVDFQGQINVSGHGGDAQGDVLYSIEKVIGSNFNDTFSNWFATGNLSIDAGAGNDLLIGGRGNDTLIGGLGNDTLFGGEGNNSLSGGAGNDTFEFWANTGKTVVTDFQAGKASGDMLSFIGVKANNFTELMSYAKQQGNNTVFDFGDGNIVTLQNVLKSQINAEDVEISSDIIFIGSGGDMSGVLI